MVGVFAYASLVSKESASETLGRPIAPIAIADLHGFRRTWSVARDNRLCEKTFARPGDGWIPDYVLLLNLVKTQTEGSLNGVLYSVSDSEMQRLVDREKRYRPVEIGEFLDFRTMNCTAVKNSSTMKSFYTFIGSSDYLVSKPPPNSCVLNSYLATTAVGFNRLGRCELETFSQTTDSHAVEVIQAKQVRGSTDNGNSLLW